MSLLDSVGYHIAMEYLDLQELVSDCIHILAVKKVVSEIDAIHDIHTQLDVSGNIIIIIIMFILCGIPKCATRQYNKNSCVHVTYINELISEHFSSSPVECRLHNPYNQLSMHIKQKPSFSCLSVHPILFSSTETQKAVLCLSSELWFNISADGVANLVPNIDSQPCTFH